VDAELAEIIRRVPRWADAGEFRVERVQGGLTNRNYRVDVDGESFLLRVTGRNGQVLGLDRAQEFRAQNAAARIGVAPEPLYLLEPEGHLVSRADGAFELAQAGFVAFVSSLAERHGLAYGVFAVVIAIASGLMVGFLFGSTRKKT